MPPLLFNPSATEKDVSRDSCPRPDVWDLHLKTSASAPRARKVTCYTFPFFRRAREADDKEKPTQYFINGITHRENRSVIS